MTGSQHRHFAAEYRNKHENLQFIGIVGLILLGGFFLRLWSIFSLHLVPFSDALDYLQLANNITSGKGYSLNGIPTAFRPPGFPLFLSIVFRITDNSLLAGQISQALLETLQCLFLFMLGKQLWSSATGIVAAAFWAVNPISIIQSHLFMPEPLFGCLFLLSLVLLFSRKAQHRNRMFLIGILWGFMVLVKPFFLFVPFLFAAWMFLLKAPFRSLTRSLCVLLFGFGLTLGPWVVRNYVEFHRPMIASNGGINLWIGNNEHANGSYRNLDDRTLSDSIRNESDRDIAAYDSARQFITTHPLVIIKLLPRKFAYLFSSESQFAVYLHNPSPAAASTPYAQRYAATPLLLHLAINLHYIFFIAVGTLGFFFASATTRTFTIFSVTCIIGWIIIHMITFGSPRFHYPLMPLFVLASAYLVTNTHTIIFTSSRKYWGIYFLLMTLFVGVLIAEIITGVTRGSV